MDLRINSIGFSGKKEILYGLNKAANLAKDSEIQKIAYVSSRMHMNNIEKGNAREASMTAYFDMVIKDSEFLKTVKNLTEKDLKPIKTILSEKRTEHGIVKPLEKFSEMLKEVVNNSYFGKAHENINAYTSELLSKLKS